MKKRLIVLADRDEDYLLPIQLKLIEVFKDNCEILLITDNEYFVEYFSMPREVDILLVNEAFYSAELHKHSIHHIFILTENESLPKSDSSEIWLYKYSGMEQMYQNMIKYGNLAPLILDSQSNEVKVVTVFSPAGGSGKTTISTSISQILANHRYKVLYISLESIQTNYLRVEDALSSDFVNGMLMQASDLADLIENEVNKSMFDSLHPTPQVPALIELGTEHYLFLIERLKQDSKYNYIVVDGGGTLDVSICKLMSLSEKVIVVTRQDEISALKLNTFLDNVDCSDDTDRFIFVCNHYEDYKKNFVTNSWMMSNPCTIKHYIKYIPAEMISLSYLAFNEDLIDLSYRIM